VDVLIELLDSDMPATTRLNAAKAILGTVVPMSEQLELRQRIDELEQSRLKVAR